MTNFKNHYGNNIQLVALICFLKNNYDKLYHPAVSKTMIDIALTRHLTQVVREPTRGKNMLDLCFTNCEQLVEKTAISPGISDHDIVTVLMSLKPPRLCRLSRRVIRRSVQSPNHTKSHQNTKINPLRLNQTWIKSYQIIQNQITPISHHKNKLAPNNIQITSNVKVK